jgi:hypothetical protein
MPSGAEVENWSFSANCKADSYLASYRSAEALRHPKADFCLYLRPDSKPN